jgi:hypothetical protein
MPTLLMRVIFALLDQDPDSESGSGFTDPIESGSATLFKRQRHEILGTIFSMKSLVPSYNIFVFIFEEICLQFWKDFS